MAQLSSHLQSDTSDNSDSSDSDSSVELEPTTSDAGNGVCGALNYMPLKKSSEEYKMNHHRMGKAVIFSFSKWSKKYQKTDAAKLPHYFFREKLPKPKSLDKSSRAQLDKDEQKIIEVLTNIGFVVEKHHNMTSLKFHETLESLKEEDHQNANCLIVIILTYGGDNTLYLSDRTQFPAHCLWTEYFEAHKCPTLAVKPKIFLVQALGESEDADTSCSGDNISEERGIKRAYEDCEDCGNFSYSIPNAADIIAAFSYPTVREGSSLINNFAHALEKHAFDLEINKIFTVTSNLMHNKEAQHLVILSTLIRQLHFRQKNEDENLEIFDTTILNSVESFHCYYDSATPRRGKAVVFNFHKFHRVHGGVTQRDRDGSKKDLEDLQNLFLKMKFDFVPHEDLSYDGFTTELKKIKDEDHSEAECLVVVVMTHGQQNRLIMADHVQFPIHFVWKYFEDHMCPSLKGKPKIFIIQACRGSEFDHGTRVKNKQESSNTSFIDSTSLSCVKPMSPDIFVAYSTPFGKFSLRNVHEGSWFIQEVVNVFSKHHNSLDIHDLFTTVARNVAINYETEEPPNKKQVPCSTSTLTKTFKFSDRTSNSDLIEQ